MGLPMEDVHTPTVASGPTSNGALRDGVEEGASLTELIAKKDSIESELSALGSVLDSVSIWKFSVDGWIPLTEVVV